MPYLLISTSIRLEIGPTMCGDEQSDPQLMKHLGAELELDSGKSYKSYKSPDSPRVILDKLGLLGYRVVGSAGVGQTCIWTLFREDN